jgi:hypothetical protein
MRFLHPTTFTSAQASSSVAYSSIRHWLQLPPSTVLYGPVQGCPHVRTTAHTCPEPVEGNRTTLALFSVQSKLPPGYRVLTAKVLF